RRELLPQKKPPPAVTHQPLDDELLPELVAMLHSMVSTNQRKVGDMSIPMMVSPPITATSQMRLVSAGALSTRSAGRFSHSDASVVSTVMMSSTPRAMPSLKLPALKRGVMALVMMTLPSASVSVPSSP